MKFLYIPKLAYYQIRPNNFAFWGQFTGYAWYNYLFAKKVNTSIICPPGRKEGAKKKKERRPNNITWRWIRS